VAQQYLPQALQGEVFWQPGALGWEGGLRKRLQQRRAAQLAAAAETAADDRGDLLSSSPDDPLLNRWLQRQAGAEGERLDRLRRHFWQDATIGRLDRVLVVDAHSLLWALDPLEAASEGEVVLTTPSAAVLDRLQAQLQLLDQLRRPRLLAVAPEAPEQLQAQLEPWPRLEGRFEWIAARQPWRGCTAEQRRAWLEQLTALAAPGARARLLFTHPLLGPAGSLRALLGRSATGATPSVLEGAASREQEWLAADAGLVDRVQEDLETLGWSVQRRFWEEALELPLGDALLERWFGQQASYRKHLALALPASGRQRLEALFRERLGSSLPQPLGHTLLLAHRHPGP
jgi:putative ATPase